MKTFAKMINLPTNSIEPIMDTYDLVENIITIHLRSIDDYLVKELYSVYKGMAVSKIFVIGLEEFEEFLRKYLPLYTEE